VQLTLQAEALGVTAANLAKSCKEATGKSAAALIREWTLHAALRLMTETPLPLPDIARGLGYGSDAYFTRVVQMQTGQTPSEHRTLAKHVA